MKVKSESESHSAVSDSLRPHGLFIPWNSPGQNTGVGSLSLLQGILSAQVSNPGLPHCRQIHYQLSHKGSGQSYQSNIWASETPVLWPPHAKSWLIGKDSDGGRDWGQEEKGTTADEMAGWHLWLDGHESQWTLGVGDGQGGLVCCNSWGCKESDTTEWLNWTELNWIL